MGSTLYVTLLGGFSIAWPDRDGPGIVDDRERLSQQLWTFLSYLCIHHRKSVDEAELARALWSDGKTVDVAGSLMALLRRARQVLEEIGFPNGSNVLLYRRGVYSWAPGLEFCLDTEELERLYMDFVAEPDETLEKVLAFLPRCQEEFLPNEGKQPWVTSLRTHYRKICHQLFYVVAERLGELYRYEEAISICRSSITLDPFDEGPQMLLMRLMHESGSTQSALWHYRSVTALYRDRKGIAPSKAMEALYKELASAGKTQTPDLDAIQKQLAARDTLARPLFCEYSVFQTVYHLMARSMTRTGMTAQMVLMTVLERDETRPVASRCEGIMEALRNAGFSNLREGDVCTRLSTNQYLLLLPSAGPEDAQMIITRCLSSFERTPIGQTVTVHTGSQPVHPIEL